MKKIFFVNIHPLRCERSTHSGSKPSSRACRVINLTLSIQVSRGYHLLLGRKNDSRESCSKSPSQSGTFMMLSPEKKRHQCATVQFCYSLRYSPTQMYTLMPDLASSDFWLFPMLKEHLHGTVFEINAQVATARYGKWNTRKLSGSGLKDGITALFLAAGTKRRSKMYCSN